MVHYFLCLACHQQYFDFWKISHVFLRGYQCWTIHGPHSSHIIHNSHISHIFFFLSGFSSQTLTIHKTAGEGRGPSFIPLYHFHPLTNIETFVCNFACEMTITYFWSQRLCLPDCYSMSFSTLSNYHLSDWLIMQCLFVYLMNWY